MRVDPERLTALVLLAVEDEGVSPMIFYRDNCADMALAPGDIDEGFIASAGAALGQVAPGGMLSSGIHAAYE